MYCEKCGTKLGDGVQFCQSCGTSVASTTSSATAVEYFAITPTRLILFSILTMNLYELYWFYRNWDAVKRAEGSNIQPFWRAWFSIFFAYDLFKRVVRSAKESGYMGSASAGWLAAAYIVLYVVGNAWGSMDAASTGTDPLTYLLWFMVSICIVPLPLLPIQSAINQHNSKVAPAKPLTKTFTGWEVAIILGGIIFMALIIIGSLLE